MSTCTVGAGTAQVPPPQGWREFFSRTWRLWVTETQAKWAEHLVIVTAEPGCLTTVASIVANVIQTQRTASPMAVRLARSPEVLHKLHDMPHWAGRAVTLYFTDRRAQLEMARVLDWALVGKGLSGPPCLRGMPYGGQSGMVFLAGGDMRQFSEPTDRLTALLDGALG